MHPEETNWAEAWTEFEHAPTQESRFQVWLSLQSRLIPDLLQAMVVVNSGESNLFTPVAHWSVDGRDAGRLLEISEQALRQRSRLIAELPRVASVGTTQDSIHVAVACPIETSGIVRGVAAYEVACQSAETLERTKELIQWGMTALELVFAREQIVQDGTRHERLLGAFDVLTKVMSEQDFQKSCLNLVTELAVRLSCDRVSLGLLDGRNIRIQAVSHSSDFTREMSLIGRIRSAMDEALLQRTDISFPQLDDEAPLIVREHEALVRHHGARTVLTLPLYGSGRYFGALTLERSRGNAFSSQEKEFCRGVTALVMPVLELRRDAGRMLHQHVAESLKRESGRLFGHDHMGRKIAAVTCIVAVILFSIVKKDYRLSADAVLEGTVRRVVVAPFAGYIRQASVRAGDVVKNGSILCVLDDRDLTVERMSWSSQEAQYEKQYQEALGKRNRAEMNIVKAKLEQAQAQLKLVQTKIERTRIPAPFDGVLVSGDLSQRLGGAVEQGEVLFEIAPLDSYRVFLKVDERRIGDVKTGMNGELLLAAMPHESLEFAVDSLTPLSTSVDGRNYFRVEARLRNAPPMLRPGMEGIGKISIDRRLVISIWTRNLMEWLKLWVWSWWP